MRGLVLVCLFAAACGNPVVVPTILEPVGATRAEPQSTALTALGNPNGFNPLSLNRALTVNARAGTLETVTLPVPFSAQSAWVALRAKQAATVTTGGQALTLTAGGSNAWALVPLAQGKLTLTASADVELTVRAGGYFDESGAGLTLATEATVEKSLAKGATPVSLPSPSSEPEDTWGAWVDVSATATDRDVWLELRGCGTEDALELLQVPAGQTVTARVLTLRATVCAYTSEPVTLKLTPIARYRRFTKTSFVTVQPLTVLDTAAGIGWRGEPRKGQPLELDLSKLDATAVVLKVGAGTVRCGEALSPGGLVLHDLKTPLCLAPLEAAHVRADVIAVVKAGDAEPLVCPALPAEGACAASDILGRLNCIPGVGAISNGKVDQYLVHVIQPVDHARPDGPTFLQRMLLTYRGPQAPVVLHTTGYELFSYRSDLGAHLDATELEVEHRFFGTSDPAPRDLSNLDIVQSAHDSHRIVELLRPVLAGKWLGTGHSKGGMTTLFHRRFFPCDVDGSVPYVTPISFGMADPRYGAFLQEVGGARYATCRQVFRDIDRGIIAHKGPLAAQLRGTYEKLGGAENALWAITGMFSWSLFQYENPDDPDRGCPAYEELASVPGQIGQVADYYAEYAESYSDQAFAQSANEPVFGYTYQVTNELGSQGASRNHLSDLGTVPTLPAVEPLSLGSTPKPQFEERSMRDVQDWLKAHGSRFLFIYGSMDPWTAGALDIAGARDALKLTAQGQNHGAGLSELTSADQLAADAALQRWLGPTAPRPKGRAALDDRPSFREVMKRLKL